MKLLTILLVGLAALGPAGDPHRPAPSFDRIAPLLPAGLQGGVLIVAKTNGWRHIEHIPHSNQVIATIATRLGRPAFVTENGAVFNDAQLRRFAVVVLNSASGDFLTPGQHAAFARFVARGGGVVALHAAGDNSHVAPWYVETIIGTRFTGHPGGDDHIQRARVVRSSSAHPVIAGLPSSWSARDEWYSFAASPAARGMRVLASIDERSYRPGDGLAMGAEHPVVWVNRRRRGRIVYSALGHTPETYDDPVYRRLLTNAIGWAAGRSTR